MARKDSQTSKAPSRESDFYETLSAQATPASILAPEASTLNWGAAAVVVLALLIAGTLVSIGYNLLARPATSTSSVAGGIAANLTGSSNLQPAENGAVLQSSNGEIQGSYSAPQLQPVSPTTLQGGYNSPPTP